MTKKFNKDPDATLDYTIDWTDWLGSDIITSSDWVIEEGLTVGTDSNTSKTTSIWLGGGTAGTRYKCTNRITTAAGRIDDRSFYLAVKEK